MCATSFMFIERTSHTDSLAPLTQYAKYLQGDVAHSRPVHKCAWDHCGRHHPEDILRTGNSHRTLRW